MVMVVWAFFVFLSTPPQIIEYSPHISSFPPSFYHVQISNYVVEVSLTVS